MQIVLEPIKTETTLGDKLDLRHILSFHKLELTRCLFIYFLATK